MSGRSGSEQDVRRRTTPPDPTADSRTDDQWFEAFLAGSSAELRRALAARFGVEVGCEVHADALVWASEHQAELRSMANPMGYLFRVGQSAARRHHRWARNGAELPAVPPDVEHLVEPGLPSALASLSDDERVAVVLVHGYGWSYADAARLLDVPVSTVNNHIHRGLQRLRRHLGVER